MTLGRPTTDPAITTRNRLLAVEVKHLAQCSWDALDARLLDFPEHETRRPRLMWSMARYGLNVATPARRRSGIDLILRIQKEPEFHEAVANYSSKLWDLLTPPGPSVAEKRALLEQLIEERGLYRATIDLQDLGNWVFPDDPTFRQRDGESMLVLANEMDSSHLLDKIALFACAYMDAMDRLDLIEANGCLHAMRWLLLIYSDAIVGITHDLLYDLVDLLTTRVLKNDWSAPLEHFRDHALRKTSREGSLSWKNTRAIPPGRGTLLPLGVEINKPPIVFKSERTQWLERHRNSVEQAYERAGRPYWPSAKFGTSSSSDISREPQKSIERRLGRKIPK